MRFISIPSHTPSCSTVYNKPCVLFPLHPIPHLVPPYIKETIYSESLLHIHTHCPIPSLRLSLAPCFEAESLRTEAAHGDSPEGRPNSDGVIEGPRGNGDGAPTRIDASGSASGQDGEEGATVGGLRAELRGRAVATSTPEEEAGTGSVVAAGEGGARSERRRKAPLTERIGFESIRKILPEGGDGLEMDVERLRSLRSEIGKAWCCSFVSAEMFVCRQLVRRAMVCLRSVVILRNLCPAARYCVCAIVTESFHFYFPAKNRRKTCGEYP